MRRQLLTPPQRRLLYVTIWVVTVVLAAIFLSKSPGVQKQSLRESAQQVTESRRSQRAPQYYNTDKAEIHLVPFDPNQADSTTLLGLGLTPYQVRMIYRFRAKGYSYHTPDDFRNVPDLTREQWRTISPYIRIDERYQLVPKVQSRRNPVSYGIASEIENQPADTTRKTVRSVVNTIVNINTADSAQLVSIRGIGPHYAGRILWYRRQLGGFTDVQQLLDMDDFPEEPLLFMTVGDNPIDNIAKIDINHLSKRHLLRHPYIRFYKADDICKYREKHGPLRSVDDLAKLPHFTPEDIQRLAPYIEFK